MKNILKDSAAISVILIVNVDDHKLFLLISTGDFHEVLAELFRPFKVYARKKTLAPKSDFI